MKQSKQTLWETAKKAGLLFSPVFHVLNSQMLMAFDIQNVYIVFLIQNKAATIIFVIDMFLFISELFHVQHVKEKRIFFF